MDDRITEPEEPQLQLSGKGWQLWGGDFKEPVPFTVAEVYQQLLDSLGAEKAQHVLDMTRKKCGELRLASKNAKGKAQKEIEEAWSNLRDELDAAIKIKTERGIVMI